MNPSTPHPFDGPALGLIEMCSIARGLVVCDAMVKRAPVRLVRATTIHPGKYVVMIRGGVDEVDEALTAARRTVGDALVDRLFLPYPHAGVDALLKTPRIDHPLDAIGIIDAFSMAGTIRAADAALKAADIRGLRLRLADHLGGKGHFVFTGLLHDVEEGLEAGRRAVGGGLLAGSELIANPHPDLVDALG